MQLIFCKTLPSLHPIDHEFSLADQPSMHCNLPRSACNILDILEMHDVLDRCIVHLCNINKSQYTQYILLLSPDASGKVE